MPGDPGWPCSSQGIAGHLETSHCNSLGLSFSSRTRASGAPKKRKKCFAVCVAGLPLLLLLLVLRVGVWRDCPNLLILIPQKQLFNPRIKDSPCLATPAKNKRLRFIVFIPWLG